MPSSQDSCCIRTGKQWGVDVYEKLDRSARSIDAFQPLLVWLAKVYWAGERAAPVGPCTVVVGMGDHDRLQTTKLIDSVDCFTVKKWYQVP